MKLLKSTVFILLLIVTIFACKKTEDNNPQDSTDGKLITKGSISMMDTAHGVVNNVDKKIRISAGSGKIVIIVDGILKGMYPINKNSNSTIQYTDKNGNIFSSKQDPSTGWVNFDLIDTVNWKLNGTFSADLYDVNKNKVSLSNGSFNNIHYTEPVGGGSNFNITKSLALNINNIPYNANNIFTIATEGNLSIVANDVGGWFRIIFPVIWKPGTYDISQGKINILYQQNNKDYIQESGQLIIEQHDFLNNKITGTFNIKVKSGNETMDINGGSFTVVY